MDKTTILKSCYSEYLTGNEPVRQINYGSMDNVGQVNKILNELSDENLITIETRAIGYVVISLTNAGIRYCEQFF